MAGTTGRGLINRHSSLTGWRLGSEIKVLDGLVSGAHLLPVCQGRGSSLGLFCKVTHPTMGVHPHDRLTSQRPHLLTPSQLQDWASALEFGGKNVWFVQHPMESSWKNQA